MSAQGLEDGDFVPPCFGKYVKLLVLYLIPLRSYHTGVPSIYEGKEIYKPYFCLNIYLGTRNVLRFVELSRYHSFETSIGRTMKSQILSFLCKFPKIVELTLSRIFGRTDD